MNKHLKESLSFCIPVILGAVVLFFVPKIWNVKELMFLWVIWTARFFYKWVFDFLEEVEAFLFLKKLPDAIRKD